MEINLYLQKKIKKLCDEHIEPVNYQKVIKRVKEEFKPVPYGKVRYGDVIAFAKYVINGEKAFIPYKPRPMSYYLGTDKNIKE